MTKDEIKSVLAGLDLTITNTFVPFSVSRSNKQDFKNLNWKVTLLKGGKTEILTTDYMMGNAHCPSYSHPDKNEKQHRIDFECEHGIAAAYVNFRGRDVQVTGAHKKVIDPDFVDFMYSITMELDVLESPSFEDWAENYGYSSDSREAERIYNACLKTALAIRASLGEDGITQLREAFQDY